MAVALGFLGRRLDRGLGIEPGLLGGGQGLLDLAVFDLERLQGGGRALVDLRVGEPRLQRRLLAVELGDPGLGLLGRLSQVDGGGTPQSWTIRNCLVRDTGRQESSGGGGISAGGNSVTMSVFNTVVLNSHSAPDAEDFDVSRHGGGGVTYRGVNNISSDNSAAARGFAYTALAAPASGPAPMFKIPAAHRRRV